MLCELPRHFDVGRGPSKSITRVFPTPKKLENHNCFDYAHHSYNIINMHIYIIYIYGCIEGLNYPLLERCSKKIERGVLKVKNIISF